MGSREFEHWIEIANSRSEVLEPIYNTALELTRLQENKKLHLYRFTDLDIIAASIIFTEVLANRTAHAYVEKNISSEDPRILHEMEQFGERIRQIVEDMTGINLKNKETL